MNKTQKLLKSRDEEFDKEFDWAISQNSRFNEVETYIKSFHATTISLLLNSLKEEADKLKNKYRNQNGWEDGVCALDDISTLLSETISNLSTLTV